MTAAPSTATRPSALRDRVLREATRLFAEHGFAGTSLRQVAEAAQCTKPALYYYFTSKEHLYQQVLEREAEAMTALVREGTADDGGPLRPRITTTLQAFIDHARTNPEAVHLLWRAEMRLDTDAPGFDVGGFRNLHRALIEQSIRRGQAAGEIRADVDAADVAIALMGTISYQFQLWLIMREEWPVGRLERTVDLVFEGIAQR